MVATNVIAFATVLLSAPLVNAHGYMSLPKVTFDVGGDNTRPAGTIDGPNTLKAPPGQSFGYSPRENTAAFTTAIKDSEYKSLRDLIEKKGNVGACGISKLGEPQDLPDMVEWSHGSGEGFTPSHEGPCEIWCDNTRVFADENCARNFPTAPAKLPYDKAKCVGASKLTTYWLALHSSSWQIYINCAALKGGAPGGAPVPAPAPGASPTMAPRPNPAPAPAPAPGPDDDCDDDLPIAGDDDCKDDLPIAGDDDCDDDLPIAGDADDDCKDDLPVAGDDDCDDDLPIAGDDDCKDDLPVAGDEDCDKDLPEPTRKPAVGGGEYGGEGDYKQNDDFVGAGIDFSTFPGNEGEDAPGKVVTPEEYFKKVG